MQVEDIELNIYNIPRIDGSLTNINKYESTVRQLSVHQHKSRSTNQIPKKSARLSAEAKYLDLLVIIEF